jgi:hypothetical protein
MTFLISDLKQRPELWHKIMFDGQLNHGGHKVTVPDKLAEELKRAGHTSPASVEPDLEPPSGRGSRAATPAQTNPWPLWAKLLRLMASNRDAGLGDILARWLKFMGGNLYKKWHLRQHGKPCKCAAHQTRLNSRFPPAKTTRE